MPSRFSQPAVAKERALQPGWERGRLAHKASYHPAIPTPSCCLDEPPGLNPVVIIALPCACRHHRGEHCFECTGHAGASCPGERQHQHTVSSGLPENTALRADGLRIDGVDLV